MKRTVLFVVLTLLAVACGPRDADEHDQNVVAVLNGEAIQRSELDLFFQVNLLEPREPETVEGQPDEEQQDRVMSRLFDAFLEEQSLLAEARRREIQVSEAEIEAYIELGREEGHGFTDLAHDSQRRLARTRLLIQKLHEEIAAQIVPPTEEEVVAFAAQNEGLPAKGKHVVFRVLPFDSEETAQSVHSEIRRNRTTFAQAAQEHETQPGEASPQTVDWNRLPVIVREALEELKPGQVSAPLDYNGLIYLFQVQAWLEDDAWFERERLRAAREQLVRRNGFRATLVLIQELKETGEIQLQTRNLGFRYIPESGT